MRLVPLAALLLAISTSAIAEPYKFDPSHTRIGYSIDHMGLSEMHGAFRKFEGTLDLDVADITKSSVSVSIDAASIDTGVAALDDHLRKPDFFDVQQYPKIHFKSTKVVSTGADTFKVTGDLEIHGVTRSVTLDAKIRTIASHPFMKVPAAGFVATTELKRADFGITTYPDALGATVKIRIDTEALQNLPKDAAK
jgi:polyisoprenoid-binding protein YceI